MEQLFLRGIGHAHPENRITNAFLESLQIGTDEAWIVQRTGIKERRTILPLPHIENTRNLDLASNLKFIREGAADMVRRAAQMALQRADIRVQDVGLVLAGGCTASRLIPSDASTYASLLGIRAPSMDLHAACSSWIAQAHFLAHLTAYETILTINCEVPTAHVSYANRRNCVLVGDGCAVTVWSRGKGSFKVTDTHFESDPSGSEKVTLNLGQHFDQDGPTVQKFAVTRMAQTFETLRGPYSTFIGHQANSRALDSVVDRVSPHQTYQNIERFGNTFSAGAASVLSEQWENHTLTDVVLAAVGSGLAWGGVRCLREH